MVCGRNAGAGVCRGTGLVGDAPQMAEGEGNPGALADESAERRLTGGSMPGFICRRGTWGGCVAPFRLTPQVGAGDDPGQDAQSIAQCLSVVRRTDRRHGPRVHAGASLPPVFVVVLSHRIPPPAPGVNCPPGPALTVEFDERHHRR